MTTDRVGKVLERVAQEVSQRVSEDDSFSTETMAAVLKERLAPLLRAGQAFHEKAVVINLRTLRVDKEELAAMNNAWDAALAALEGRE